MQSKKFIALREWEVSSRVFKQEFCIRCQPLPFAGQPTNFSNIFWIGRKRKRQLFRRWRQWFLQKTINHLNNLYILFCKKSHLLKFWEIFPVHQFILHQLHHLLCHILESYPLCQMVLCMLIQCTKIVLLQSLQNFGLLNNSASVEMLWNCYWNTYKQFTN